jgi:hypothetical protein
VDHPGGPPANEIQDRHHAAGDYYLKADFQVMDGDRDLDAVAGELVRIASPSVGEGAAEAAETSGVTSWM